MPVGANIKYGPQKRIWSHVMKILSQAPNSPTKVTGRLCYKAGTPSNNTAADNPNQKYDICVDTTNDEVYICTAWTADASATTWTKFSD